jgi:hypothetical protein
MRACIVVEFAQQKNSGFDFDTRKTEHLLKDLFLNPLILVSMVILRRGWCFNCQCKQPILIVCELGQEEETVTRLSRGF